jgi:hypothetical protein
MLPTAIIAIEPVSIRTTMAAVLLAAFQASLLHDSVADFRYDEAGCPTFLDPHC